MGLGLQAGVSIAVADHRPILRREGVAVDHPLSISDALALVLIDATGDAGAAAEALSTATGTDRGPVWVASAVHRFWPFLRDGPSRHHGAIDLTWLRTVVGHPDALARQPARAPAPRALTWLVTLACNRRCPYCYYDVLHHAAGAPSPADATLPAERAVAMVQEMGRLGTSDLYLTGGEPLLRSDLCEIIAEATHARVRTHLVTKYAIDRDLARRLASAGVSHVTVSLDDARPKQAAMLAGARDYQREAEASIAALLAEGVVLDVNAVVNRANESALDELAERLICLGVPRLTLGRWAPPASARRSALRLAPSGVPFEERRSELRERFAGRLRIESSGSDGGDTGDRACGGSIVCDVGLTALDVLPDGRVTRCRYLPGRSELVVGSVATGSLLAIWRGEALARWTAPPREAYADTECAGCGAFDACHARGRCFFTAFQTSGRMHAPDAFCRR